MEHWVHCVLEEAVRKEQLSEDLWKSIQRITQIIESSDFYNFRTKKGEGLFDRLQDCAIPQDLSRSVFDIATSYGFQHGTLFLVRAGSTNSIWRQRVITSLPEKWLRYYSSKNYQYVDPVIAYALTNSEPNIITKRSDDPPMIKCFWDDAERHGVGSVTACLPQKLDSGATIGFSMTSQCSRITSIKDLTMDICDISMLARHAAEIFETISAVGSDRDCELSPTEIDFLKSVLFDGKTEGIFDSQGFRTSAQAIQANISRKLGVTNVFQAVAIAASRGWFDEVAYGEGEVSALFANLPGLEKIMGDPDSGTA